MKYVWVIERGDTREWEPLSLTMLGEQTNTSYRVEAFFTRKEARAVMNVERKLMKVPLRVKKYAKGVV